MRSIGLLGGTFNPIHHGHLRIGIEAAEAFDLDEVKFVPASQPPHKATPIVSANHRAAMVKLAIANTPKFSLDIQELSRPGFSYTIDTLISLRQTLTNKDQIFFIIGLDAFNHLDRWHRWKELLNYCHMIIVNRPSALPEHINPSILSSLDKKILSSPIAKPGGTGHIFQLNITQLDISSTAIRQCIAEHRNPSYLLPDAVKEYIEQYRLYV